VVKIFLIPKLKSQHGRRRGRWVVLTGGMPGWMVVGRQFDILQLDGNSESTLPCDVVLLLDAQRRLSQPCRLMQAAWLIPTGFVDWTNSTLVTKCRSLRELLSLFLQAGLAGYW
jgi:hypothetical protein